MVENTKAKETMERVKELRIKIDEYQNVRRKLLRELDGIADSAVGVNQFILEITVYFITQPGYEHVDDVGLGVKIVAP
jgi:hypothetical protein